MFVVSEVELTEGLEVALLSERKLPEPVATPAIPIDAEPLLTLPASDL